MQLWCVIDKQVPPDLTQDILELWQELHAAFSKVPGMATSSSDPAQTHHTKRMQQALMHALLGQDSPKELSRGMLYFSSSLDSVLCP